ncbi:hypothetical protein LWI29_003523 [Acer saccharum]|uniref:Uncharacterized protein n=1 Tax=Acer saccharum TaxID=4024 RepID=A0AA39SU73_ACESA|nr:hypothetical protein LWI29_003523 [Acer saccharum]
MKKMNGESVKSETSGTVYARGTVHSWYCSCGGTVHDGTVHRAWTQKEIPCARSNRGKESVERKERTCRSSPRPQIRGKMPALLHV